MHPVLKSHSLFLQLVFLPVCVVQLFQQCRLVQRILDAWEENDRIQYDLLQFFVLEHLIKDT